MNAPSSQLDDVTRRAHRSLIDSSASLDNLGAADIRARVESVAPLLSSTELDQVVSQVSRLLFGFGPLEPLLGDPDIDEVMVNGPGRVWIERRGEVVPTSVYVDAEMLRVIVDRVLAPLGLRVDRMSPFADARLPDGSRVNIAVPPLAVDGPYITIRRFRAKPFLLSDFCSQEIEAVLRGAIASRKSIVVSGGTGSGKTTLLNALGAHIEPNERVVTIEDAAELRLPGDHTVRLESRPANAEGVGQVTIRSLLRNALRMRPDRIVVGEVRGAEALDMIQAMNTGHEGSMSTCHANSPLDALRRLEAMALMGDVDLPLAVVREHLHVGVNLVVHVERSDQGQRQVRSVYRCTPGSERWLVREGSLVVEPDSDELTIGALSRREPANPMVMADALGPDLNGPDVAEPTTHLLGLARHRS